MSFSPTRSVSSRLPASHPRAGPGRIGRGSREKSLLLFMCWLCSCFRLFVYCYIFSRGFQQIRREKICTPCGQHREGCQTTSGFVTKRTKTTRTPCKVKSCFRIVPVTMSSRNLGHCKVRFGWRYLSNAPCLILPYEFCALFVVSRTTTVCQIICHF